MILEMIQVQKVKWYMKQTSSKVAHGWLAHMDRHPTSKPVMLSAMSSTPIGGNFSLNFSKPLDVNSDLKCKFDLIVKNSI